MAVVVTGYVRLDSQHRSHARYVELGRRLVGLGLPTIAFYDGSPAELMPTPKSAILRTSLADCWMAPGAAQCEAPGGTPLKDTTTYCAVQHQKTTWLARAAADTGEAVVWIDFGIFHLPQLNNRHILKFVDRVEAAPPDRITIAGIWPMTGRPLINWSKPAWYVAGGVVVVPHRLAGWFDATVRSYATLQMEASRRTTWEVNTWSAILRDHPDRFRVYAADHDETLFTNYEKAPPCVR